MDIDDVPRFNKAKYDERITVPVRGDTKYRLDKLKVEKQINYVAWIRELIEKSIEQLEKIK